MDKRKLILEGLEEKRLIDINEDFSKPYAGLPSCGGFGARTEYEVGMQRVAEAAHCVIGSLVRTLQRDGNLRVSSLGHIDEEIGIMKKVASEYNRNIYVDMFNRAEDKNGEGAIPDILKIAKKLREQAKRLVVKIPGKKGDDIYDLAFLSLQVIASLCNSIIDNLKSFPIKENLFYNIRLRASIYDLEERYKRAKAKHA